MISSFYKQIFLGNCTIKGIKNPLTIKAKGRNLRRLWSFLLSLAESVILGVKGLNLNDTKIPFNAFLFLTDEPHQYLIASGKICEFYKPVTFWKAPKDLTQLWCFCSRHFCRKVMSWGSNSSQLLWGALPQT